MARQPRLGVAWLASVQSFRHSLVCLAGYSHMKGLCASMGNACPKSTGDDQKIEACLGSRARCGASRFPDIQLRFPGISAVESHRRHGNALAGVLSGCTKLGGVQLSERRAEAPAAALNARWRVVYGEFRSPYLTQVKT